MGPASEFHVDWTEPEALVQEVFKTETRPTIVSEAFDGMSGGAPGDNPGLLSLLLPHAGELSACLLIIDPDAAQLAFRVGAEGDFHGPLGAFSDKRFGNPIVVDARVRHLSNGDFVMKGPVFTGRKVSMGRPRCWRSED